jgi:two-component system, chemotaxis family, CheB/CheR fusion protein
VLNNLLENAIKYSSPDKPVTIGIAHPSQPTSEVVVWVRDEGSGIGEEEQAHIFDRFYRVLASESPQIKGLGLGLYISHEIIIHHGGRMWLESKPGAGSTFYFSLPL